MNFYELCLSALSSHYRNFHLNSRRLIAEAMKVWTEQTEIIMPSEIIYENCTARSHSSDIFQYHPGGTAGHFGWLSIQFVCVCCVCVCACICHMCFSCANHIITPGSVLSFGWVCVCACSLLCGVLFFLNGILSMKTSDWTKYHGTHQGRCTQRDCLFLSHHSFLLKQSLNSNRLPKTHLDTALRGPGIHINTLYCTFSITFYKSGYHCTKSQCSIAD